MAAGEEQGGCGSRWTASTNWILAGGSLQNAISFETSEEDAPSPAISDPLLLVRPPAVAEEDFLPCEVTILFSGQYEIHRIYVRSTARVYEIYYAADERSNSMEYLCTVQCGVAAREMTPPISSMVSVESESVSHTLLEKQDKMSVANSNCSNEDGWVEVVADSALHDVKRNSVSRQVDENSDANFQTYYEATADISDFSPCMAVTLRFLSLQTKTHVHISEIYVYVDPVETLSSGTPATTEENFGGSSLLTMFMPTLLQLSKSARSRQNHFSDAFGVQRNQDGRQNTAEVASTGIRLPLETNSNKGDLLLRVHESSQFKPEFISSALNMEVTDKESDSSFGNKKMDLVHEKINPENRHLRFDPEATEDIASSSTILHETKKIHENMHFSDSKIQINPDQISISAKERVIPGNCIENVLDELVSRVTRIEEVCSRFEEHLVKPLSSIEGRLQKLEAMLEKFTQGNQFHRPGGSSRIFLPEYFSDGSDLDNKDTNESSCTSRDGIILHDSSLAADVLENPSPIVDVREIATESKISPGFEIKAPEFAIEDDECLQCDSTLATEVNFGEAKKVSSIDNDDDECGKADVVNELGRDDASLPCNVSSGEGKKFLSIDHALTSSLEAFMCSEIRPKVVPERHNLPATAKNSSSSPARDFSIGAGNSNRSLNEMEDEIAARDSLSFPSASKKIVNDSDKDTDRSTFNILEASDAFDDLFIPCDTLMSSSPFLDDGLELMAPDWGNFVASKECQGSLLNARDEVRANHDGPSSSQFGEESNESSVPDNYSGQAGNGTTHLDSNQAEETPELPSSFDPVLEINFITEQDWTSGIPLEILLGVASDSKAEDSIVADTNEEGIISDQLLDGIENVSFPADSSCSHNDGVAESSPEVDLDGLGLQNFYSLI